jgi:phage regulator Rha-like protein
MENKLILNASLIESKIYSIRGFKVMIDSDLAEMYHIETKRLKEQVRRNINRFPNHFMFELTKDETDFLRSQNATLKRGAHSKYPPFAFTEHGLLMLANILKSEKAEAISIQIIDIFIKLRETILSNKEILLKIEKLDKAIINLGFDVRMHDDEINSIFNLIDEINLVKSKAKKITVVKGFKQHKK